MNQALTDDLDDGVHMARTILVVDDEAPIRNLVASVLKQDGYCVTEAASAAEALRLLEMSPEPALLLTDIKMPEIDGIELARQATQFRPEMKVVYMTGYSAQRLAPGTAVIEKPFTARRLLDQVRCVLAGQHPNTPKHSNS